ncbi:hypothetical protein NQZ68_027627 [Dissostichus eleginoides]|nr:hypothetical protein NQZ68_027627 [Dissostichus eleginoides]
MLHLEGSSHVINLCISGCAGRWSRGLPGWIALDGSLIIWPPVRTPAGPELRQHNRWALKGPTTSALLQQDEEGDEGG